jgi:tetratricopeptide (TPR) repeat protein
MRDRLGYLVRLAIAAIGGLFILLLPLRSQESARADVSPFGAVGLAPGETLTLRATGASPGEGCKAQLGFNDTDGRSVTRSLNVNLAPGQSAFTNYVAKNQPQARTAIRPVAWVDRTTAPGSTCLLVAQVKSQSEGPLRAISSETNCDRANCKAVSVADLNRLTLRLYVAASTRICRAQMGFRQSNGRTSVAAKYVTLVPNHAAWLDWRAGDDDLPSTDSVIPTVAFHPGDSCIASSEMFAVENEPATARVPVHAYESSVVGLAMDQASLAKTIEVLRNELQTNPGNLWAINSLAQAYANHGERVQAVKLLWSHLEINPRASESWLLLAKLQFQQRDYASALVSLERCLTLDPDNMTAKAAFADSLTKVGRLDEAGGLFMKLLANDKARAPALLTAYAEFLYAEGRFAEALAPAEEADARHPKCGRTLLVEAQVLQALEHIPEATLSAERAVQLNPDSRSARLLLMRLYHRQGQKREAAEQEAWLKDNANSSYK